MSKIKRQKIDQIGIITSGLCAVHCAALPLLLSFGFVTGMNGMAHEAIEVLIIVISFSLGGWSVYNGMIGHGKLIPQLLIGLGAIAIILGLLFSFLGHGIMAAGGCALLYGHWLNWRQISIVE